MSVFSNAEIKSFFFFLPTLRWPDFSSLRYTIYRLLQPSIYVLLFWCKRPGSAVDVSADQTRLFWSLCPSDPQSLPACHTIIWPMQTLTASHSRACLMERSSWTASSRLSSLETRACHSGGRGPSRPGWRLSWECPCTSALAQRTSKAGRYVRPERPPRLLTRLVFRCCPKEGGNVWSSGAAGPDRRGSGAGSGYHSPHPSQEAETGHRGLQESWGGAKVSSNRALPPPRCAAMSIYTCWLLLSAPHPDYQRPLRWTTTGSRRRGWVTWGCLSTPSRSSLI